MDWGTGRGLPLATQKAIGYLEEHYREAPTEIVRGCHEALRDTRGAALGLALIDPERSTLTYVGIGNIEIPVVGEESHSLPSQYGIVGANVRKIRTEEIAYNPGNLVIMHSDGISAKFSLGDYPGLRQMDPKRIAEVIVRDYAREYDDSLIVVAR